MGSLNYARYSDHPALIELCEACKRPDCPEGICGLYKDKWRELFGCPPKRKRESALDPMRLGAYNRPMTAFGESRSLAAWARLYDIPYRTLYQRLSRGGYTLERALAAGRRSGRHFREPKKYTHDGESLSIREWAEKTGICEETIRARIERGWNVDKAVTKPAVYKKHS